MIDFRRLIYHLKQSYGTEVDLYKENNEVLDALTGRVTVINTKYTIKKAIVLPSDTSASSPFLRQANLSIQAIWYIRYRSTTSYFRF
jgi:hypothetical protein